MNPDCDIPDNHDEDLNAAFADLRAHAALTFTAPGAAQVYQVVRERKARTLRLSAAVAVLAASGLLIAGMTVRPAPPQHGKELLGTAGTWAPSPAGPASSSSREPAESAAEPAVSPGGSRSPNAPRPDLANQVRFLGPQKIVQLRGSTIALPPWPAASQACPAGTYTFRDGKVPTGATDAIGRPFDYLMLFRGSLGIYANLDGVPGDELVVPLACGFTEVQYQLLVLKEGTDGPDALGYLPAFPAFDRFYPYGEGLVVEVFSDPFGPAAEQRRRYGWNGSRFVQTHGPVAFPANPFPDVRQIDLRQSYFSLDECGGGTLSFLDGVSGTWPYADRDDPGGDAKPAFGFLLGEVSTGLLREPPEFAAEGDALVTVECKPQGGARTVWVMKVSRARAVPLLKVGEAGAIAVVAHRIAGGLAEVTVQTQAGRQVWRFSSNGYTMTRVP